jgi:hypothetical protein
MFEITKEHGINLSLDEYIRRNNMDGQFSMLDMRKKDKNIDKEELDASLDKMARMNEIARAKTSNSRDKFDRFKDSNDSESDDDEKFPRDSFKRTDTDDVEMKDAESFATENSSIRFAQEIQQMDHPDCCKFKEFKTVESELGIKVRPQQWRLQKVRQF